MNELQIRSLLAGEFHTDCTDLKELPCRPAMETAANPAVKQEVEDEQCCFDLTSQGWFPCGVLCQKDPLSLEGGLVGAAPSLLLPVAQGENSDVSSVPVKGEIKQEQPVDVTEGTDSDVSCTLVRGDIKEEPPLDLDDDTLSETSDVSVKEDIGDVVVPSAQVHDCPILSTVGSPKAEPASETCGSLQPAAPHFLRGQQAGIVSAHEDTLGCVQQLIAAQNNVQSGTKTFLMYVLPTGILLLPLKLPPNGMKPRDRESPSNVEEQGPCDRHEGDLGSPCLNCGDTVTGEGEPSVRPRTPRVSKQLYCNAGGKKFKRRMDLKVHFRIHTGEKPYRCVSCEKAFPSYGQWQSHSCQHTGRRQTFCSLCGRAFRHSWNLAYHKLVHTGEKPYGCSECEKSFRSKHDLKRHVLVHRREPRYRCLVCAKPFRSRLSLNTHTSTHTKELPYSCNVCGGRFEANRELSLHTTRGACAEQANCAEWMECAQCGKQFNKKNALVLHILRAHKLPRV